MVREPPNPFSPQTEMLAAGQPLFRVYSNRVPSPVSFNPGFGSGGRFHFFGDPLIPVLYAAETQIAAVCETILHEVPKKGGYVEHEDYRTSVMAEIQPASELRLASFLGTGLRTLGIGAVNLTDTTSSHYPRTVKWAEAAHAAGFDGVAWMSGRENSSKAYMFFGDRVSESDLEVSPGGVSRIFASGKDFDWLVDHCAVMKIDVMPPV
ncbi:RES family NAD+ phosphorylase [Arthrobacter flavus]|uniref:RES family NAD+ phosphorylase n=1 Tax=Arthrobacter flavus TaxID=95172 RepID=A0ABW4Q9V4_9MICC